MAGLGLAGLGEGMLNARNANTQRAQVQLEAQRLGLLDRQQRDAQQAKIMEDARKSIGELQATFDKTARAIVARGGPEALASPQARQQLATIMQPAMQTGIMAGIAPEVLAQQFAATLESAKTETTVAQKAQDAASLEAGKPTSVQKNAEALGLAPGTPEYADYIRQVTTKPQTQVTVSNVAETEEAKQNAKLGVARDFKILSAIDESATMAQKLNESLDFVDANIEKAATGKFAGVRTALGQFVAGMGIDPKLVGTDINQIASAESFSSATADIVLARATQLKGSMSDRDVKFLVDAAPALSTTQQGNKLIVQYMRRMNDRAILKQEMAESYKLENGSMYGFNAKWARFVQENPLFSELDKKQRDAASRGTPMTALGVQDPQNPNAILPSYDVSGGTLKPVR